MMDDFIVTPRHYPHPIAQAKGASRRVARDAVNCEIEFSHFENRVGVLG